jgi:hypothetical protein
MIESPILQKLFREIELKTRQTVILETLEDRFGPVPVDVSASVRVIQDEIHLQILTHDAYTCLSLDAFRQTLTPPQDPTAN